MNSRPLIIGADIRDLYEAWTRGAYLVLNKPRPIEYGLGYPNSQGDIWSYLYWKLFFRGDVFTEQVKFIKILDKGQVLITTRFGDVALDFEPTEIMLSCLDNVDPPCDSYLVTSEFYKVLDFFDVNQGAIHDKWLISTENRFCNQIQFYLSDRIDGNTTKKDLFVASRLSEKDLSDFEYSDTMVRFKLEELLKSCFTNKKGIKVTHTWRHVEKVREFTLNNFPKLKKTPGDTYLKQAEVSKIEQCNY